jgi:hypothetical protein
MGNVYRIFLFSVSFLLLRTDEISAQDHVFDHPADSRVWISGQINVIHQQHPSFYAKYSGENSLKPEREKATSSVLTLYTGFEITKSTGVLADFESAGGRGISDALGLAGFTNLDVVRNPSLGSKPYLARFLLHQTISLGGNTSPSERTYLSLSPEKTEKRIEIYAGKLSVADFFDMNSVGSDSHFQFMNWTVDNNGAYDYAADTRGYTYGVIVDYEHPEWAVRFGEALMPKVANGIDLEWSISRARAENLEFQARPSLWADHPTQVRILAFLNHANMGIYRDAINAFLEGRDPVPDIEAHRQEGRKKYGFGLNGEQQLTRDFSLYGRAGWNEGAHESFAYTEIDRGASFGGSLQGSLWKRVNDKVGAAFVFNAISGDHRQYLQLGGKGFLLGDGNLTYGLEEILETYYTARIVRGVYLAFDFQHVNNPGYNRDRGPVLVPSARLHVEF